MHVGLYTESFPPLVDGVAQAVQNYAKYLNRICDVTVVAPAYKNVVDHSDYPIFRYQSLPTGSKMEYRAGNPFNPETLHTLREQRFDIIHTHAPFASAILAKNTNRRRPKAPVILTYHTRYEVDIITRITNRAFRKIALQFLLDNLNAMDEIWAVTDTCGEALRHVGYQGAYMVMENGTDFAYGKAPEEKVLQLREAYSLDDESFVFLYVGRMMWYKNIRLTLDALKLAKERKLSFKMFMIGPGAEVKEIQAYAAEIGLGDDIIFTGPIFDREYLRVFYSMADMFLFPSTYDTSGIVVKEAAACDCPTLLIKGSCAAEGAVHDLSAFLAEEETAECCAEALLRACDSRDNLKDVGGQAGKLLYLSWKTAVQRAYAQYETILQGWSDKRQQRIG